MGSNKPSCFIQWKGTNVCIDLHCTCGKHFHFDGDFLYSWECYNCGKCWEMGTQVEMKACEPRVGTKKMTREDE